MPCCLAQKHHHLLWPAVVSLPEHKGMAPLSPSAGCLWPPQCRLSPQFHPPAGPDTSRPALHQSGKLRLKVPLLCHLGWGVHLACPATSDHVATQAEPAGSTPPLDTACKSQHTPRSNPVPETPPVSFLLKLRVAFSLLDPACPDGVLLPGGRVKAQGSPVSAPSESSAPTPPRPPRMDWNLAAVIVVSISSWSPSPIT